MTLVPVTFTPTGSGLAEWARKVAYAINRPPARDVSAYSGSIGSADQIVTVDATSGPVTVNLPRAQDFPGRQITVKKVDASANAVTIDGDGSQTIDGATTKAISTQWATYTLTSNGSDGWLIT